MYTVSVYARNGESNSTAAQIVVYTEVSAPPKPQAPVLVNKTETNVTITLKEVIHDSGPITAYYVMVSTAATQNRRKRQTEQELLQEMLNTNGYVTAKFFARDIKTQLIFTVGDNKKYLQYRNLALVKDTLYNISFIVESSLDQVTKRSWNSFIVLTPGAPPPGDNVILIVGICLGFLVLIILVILIVVLVLRHRRLKKAQDLKPSWLEYYKNHFTHEMPSKFTGWSDIYDIKEPRYVKIADPDVPNGDPTLSDTMAKQPPITFNQEFLRLPHGQSYPWKVAQRRANTDKNRFDHILAYDHSRVVLRKTPPNVSDYINANYINGYKVQKAYIAAQSPFNDLTINDFWQMIFQENVGQIVMIANPIEDGIVKCEPYWPNGGSQKYRSIQVLLVKELEFANFTIREFLVTDENVNHKVVQYHFTTWPEHGVPSDPIPFLEFQNRVSREVSDNHGPMLVHCGTGVSRTAVFIAVDSLLQQALSEGLVNVFTFSKQMRRNRTFMIRTVKQYLFIYDTLFEALQTSHNIVGENNLKTNYRLLANINPLSQKSYFREQFELMERFTPALPVEKCASGTLQINTQKNRFSTLVPPDNYRPRIRSSMMNSDYVNAVFVDSYVQSNAFVVTQTPLESTVVDFWSLIYDHDVYSIVMMNDENFKEETCANYWPSQAKGGRLKVQNFIVELLSVKPGANVTVREMTLVNVTNMDEPTRRIKQFQLNGWRMYDKKPPSRVAIFEIIECVEQWKDTLDVATSPVLVHCMDGGSRSGLFCAVRVLCEKLSIDGEVDVYHTIKEMKKRRPLIVSRVVSENC